MVRDSHGSAGCDGKSRTVILRLLKVEERERSRKSLITAIKLHRSARCAKRTAVIRERSAERHLLIQSRVKSSACYRYVAVHIECSNWESDRCSG